jgi:hypothetical protein
MKRAVAAAAAVGALVAAFLVSGALASHGGPGFKTAKPPYLVPTAPGVQVDPILSVGDVVGGGPAHHPPYQMSGIPDGLGAYRKKSHGRWHWFHTRGSDRTAVVVMNHELGRSFPNNPPGVDTRITRLEIDTRTRSVHRAEYLFTGLEGYERFCSATLRVIRGEPLYFTGEEAVPSANPPQPPGPAHDGSSIVMNPETGMWRDLGHMGHLQHENLMPLRLKKWVFATTEDDFRPGPSYYYAYFHDSFDLALRGIEVEPNDGLHVFVPNVGEERSNAEVTTKTQVVHGRWVKLNQIPDNTAAGVCSPASVSGCASTALKAAATREGAFRFDRMEDLAAVPGRESRVYLADTGKPPATARGRIYVFDFDRNDPYRASMRMILNGDAPHNDDIYNPDNMDASKRVLMIQEDRESAFRDPPFSGGYGRVMEYRFSDGRLRSVARVNTPPPLRPGTWESSGIIDASRVLGNGWWLLDVQAHSTTAPQPGPTLTPNSSTGEDGQLLAMFVPGSTDGGGDGDDDDDDDD